MFGYVLWMPEESLAQKSMEFTVIGSNSYQAPRSRYCPNLRVKLQADFQNTGLGAPISGKWLEELLTLAKERADWFQIKDWTLL